MSFANDIHLRPNCLQGYRVGFFNIGEPEFLGARLLGAETLIIDKTKPEEEFRNWWKSEVDRARRDHVVLVVLDHFCRCGSEYCSKPPTTQKKWLEKIEEEEWYSGCAAGQVRFTGLRKLLHSMETGELLEDAWGDYIEKGDASKNER